MCSFTGKLICDQVASFIPQSFSVSLFFLYDFVGFAFQTSRRCDDMNSPRLIADTRH